MIQAGIDIFIKDIGRYRNRSIALIANHTSFSAKYQYLWDSVIDNGLVLRAVFSPEHGIFGTEQDQVAVETQPAFPFPVISLYGMDFQSLTPKEEHLRDVDCVIFDIQDIGSRYYTYVNTMVLFMKALHGRDIEFVVLDRPNPIGGEAVEGPVLREGFESFVGVLPVPVRHGMTAGELALFARDRFRLDINLKVVPMTGWKRPMLFPETGLPWAPPSPNMPDPETALLYPGLCLVEGLNMSEGRGTACPFKLIGAPYINAFEFAAALNDSALPGVFFRPHCFRPQFNKFSGQVCGGVYLHITDPGTFNPFISGVAVTKTANDLYEEFAFLSGVYEFNSIHPAFDLLTGCSRIREMIEAGDSLSAIREWYGNDEKGFAAIKDEFRLY